MRESPVRETLVGDFETHLTVAPVGDDALRSWAREHGAKYTRILLDRGGTPDQPMLTFTGRGTVTAQRAAAEDGARALRNAGFTVVRVKIEASPFNADVPMETGEPGRYFEHHVKLVLDGEVDQVREIAVGHGAHLSRNARRETSDGRHERFVTQRCHGVGRTAARKHLDRLLAALGGYQIAEVEQQYVILDDHPTLDDGWLPQ
jgi:hypothetical protein